MKAIVLNHPGGAQNLEMEERPIPKPQKGEVLVKVRAFGLNRSELMTRKGVSPNVNFPRVLGIECVGEVAEDPSGEYKFGQKVAACMGGMGRDFDGSYQEYAVLPRSILTPFQSRLEWSVLGALPELFQTVFGSLELALNIKKNESLLIRGGSSSIGLMAAQWAKLKGCRVISTTRNPKNQEVLLSNGADHVLIDVGTVAEKVREFFPKGVEKALELIGTNTLGDSMLSVQSGGLLCFTGMLSENWSISDFAPMDFIPSTVGLTTFHSGSIDVDAEAFQDFIQNIEKGIVNPQISRVIPLSHIVEAHQLMESNQASGKIVVVT
ncbi:zinc-binding alcohol dehydrogenase family protein [Algoriphagus sp.]|uniref:zinc-binding alcohol dehydrogenase family protein n=1 Tax=Algoriphagus sp. TaxID=1872435 RepID=UPI002610876D|nr:zinc-binding alcohol dehydrogenase family protein [Algoriphagus sp.]